MHDEIAVSPKASSRTRVLGVTCGTHALHDGFTDALYVLLPLWQAEFGLSYAAVGLLRASYSGAMAGATALLLTLMPWRPAAMLLGVAGIASAALILLLLPNGGRAAARAPSAKPQAMSALGADLRGNPGLSLLLAIGMIDSATRMG